MRRPPTAGSLIDDLCDVVREADDLLGDEVAGSGLAGQDLDPRQPVLGGLGADLVIERDAMQDVEQLPLVFVDALDLDVEQRVRVHGQADTVLDHPGQRRLRGEALGGELGLQRRVAGMGARSRIASLSDSTRAPSVSTSSWVSARVRAMQPSAEGDAVGLVLDPAGIDLRHLLEDRAADQLGVQGGDAVDGVRAEESQWPIRTRRPCFSSISEREASRLSSAPGCARTCSRWRAFSR